MMRSVLTAVAVLASIAASPGNAAPAHASLRSVRSERFRAAMQSARWTGPMLASTAETLPRGHVYTEPYLYDVISRGAHHPGSSGFYQYGLLDELTVGLQPSFALGVRRTDRDFALGDFKLISQLRLTHFTPEHRVPTVSIVLDEDLPTGKFDHLQASKEGHGSGAFATEIGINVQHYFLLRNDRLLRARFNVLKSLPNRAKVTGRSTYGTGPQFHGYARPGSRTTMIGALEYSLTDTWVLALDVEHDHWAPTRVSGRDARGRASSTRTIPASSDIGLAPAIEYNWNDRTGVLLGIWIVPKGHNVHASVTPALAISRFW